MLNILIHSEILRVIDSVQLTDSHKVATPVDWKVSLIQIFFLFFKLYIFLIFSIHSKQVGDECMVLPTIKNEDCAGLFPKGVNTFEVPSGKCYLRKTPYPAPN